jgi:MscS family membrane protein
VILAVTALVNALMKAAADWYLHELAGKNEATWDEELLPLVRRILSLVIYFIGLSIVFERFGYPITALITTAGVASLAVALAAQETLSNMLGGLVILVDRPFRVGDVIELSDGKAGEVIEIGLRSTRIRQFDGNALVVPNKDMANTRIVNLAQPNHRAAIRQTIGVSFGSDVERVKQVLLDVMMAHPDVLKDPAPGVWFTKFNTSSLDLFISCWVESYKDRFRVTDELNIAILRAFREHGIEIPFPQQDVHLYVREGEKVSW